MAGFWNDHDDFRDIPDEVNGTAEIPNFPNENLNVSTIERKRVPIQDKTEVESSEELVEFEEVLESSEGDADASEDYSAVLSDARSRLEQGRLYEMIMNHDLFNGLDADPKAVRSVQKEIRGFAKERMEIMLGMRQEEKKTINEQVYIPFNNLEIKVLKKLASTATKGLTESPEAEEVQHKRLDSLNPIQVPPRKELHSLPSIAKPRAIIPTVKASSKPLQVSSKPLSRSKTATKEAYKPLDKDPVDMSPEELMERNREASKRSAGKKAAKQPGTGLPQPTFEQEQFLAQTHAMNAADSPGFNRLMNVMNVLSKQVKK